MIFTDKMAHLYGTTQPPSSNPEDISMYLQTLFHHNASSASSSSTPFKTQLVCSLSASSPPENMAAVGVVSDPRDGVNFSDRGIYFQAEAKESVGNAFYSVGVVDSYSNTSSKRKGISSENDLGEFSCESEKGPEMSEVPSNPAPPRSSSKRTRAAEVHNLSEKRRRSKINEKMKALQSLIPNSNKTDKASMLDEAIEYLKQLQLQVQMLTMRNGLSLHPMCVPGVLQPMPLPPTGMGLDELNGNGLLNSNRGAGTVHTNQETPMQTLCNLSNHDASLSQTPGIVSPGNITSSGTAYGFELPMQVPLEHFNGPSSSKEISREEMLPQLQVDSNQCCHNPPSDVS